MYIIFKLYSNKHITFATLKTISMSSVGIQWPDKSSSNDQHENAAAADTIQQADEDLLHCTGETWLNSKPTYHRA